MNYKIKQIKDIKNCSYSFRFWSYAKDKLSLDDYETVYEGTIDSRNKSPEQVAEELFIIFNTRHPEGFVGHSLSISDIVELDGVNYYCDIDSWEKID